MQNNAVYPFKEPPRKDDNVRRTEEEYYNKKDLLPKLTKPQDQVEGEKKVKYYKKKIFGSILVRELTFLIPGAITGGG